MDQEVRVILNHADATLRNQQGFAYNLGLLTQIAFKHSSAQRSEKFFSSIKKLERNSRKFVNLQLKITVGKANGITIMNEDSKSLLNCLLRTLRIVFKILQECSKNCLECTCHCFRQLGIEHFIPLHTLLTSVCSNIYAFLQDLLCHIENWYIKLSTFAAKWGIFSPILQPMFNRCSAQFTKQGFPQFTRVPQVPVPFLPNNSDAPEDKITSVMHTKKVKTSFVGKADINEDLGVIVCRNTFTNTKVTQDEKLNLKLDRKISFTEKEKPLKKLTSLKSNQRQKTLFKPQSTKGHCKRNQFFSKQLHNKTNQFSLKYKPYHYRFMYYCFLSKHYK